MRRFKRVKSERESHISVFREDEEIPESAVAGADDMLSRARAALGAENAVAFYVVVGSRLDGGLFAVEAFAGSKGTSLQENTSLFTTAGDAAVKTLRELIEQQ